MGLPPVVVFDTAWLFLGEGNDEAGTPVKSLHSQGHCQGCTNNVRVRPHTQSQILPLCTAELQRGVKLALFETSVN